MHAVENIDEIIRECDGIIISRTSLSVALIREKVFLAQKSIIAKCNKVCMIYVSCFSSISICFVFSLSKYHQLLQLKCYGVQKFSTQHKNLFQSTIYCMKCIPNHDIYCLSCNYLVWVKSHIVCHFVRSIRVK